MDRTYFMSFKCYPKIMNVNIKDTQTEFFKRERQKFEEDVTNHYWKKYWVFAILKVINRKKRLEPAVQAFFSIQRLQYVDEMSYKLERGIHEFRFNEIYDERVKILKERVYHPIWNHEDMEFVKNMMSGNNVGKMLLE